MCILKSVKENSTIKEKFDLKDEDLISENKVAVYQLTDCGTFAEVDSGYIPRTLHLMYQHLLIH